MFRNLTNSMHRRSTETDSVAAERSWARMRFRATSSNDRFHKKCTHQKCGIPFPHPPRNLCRKSSPELTTSKTFAVIQTTVHLCLQRRLLVLLPELEMAYLSTAHLIIRTSTEVLEWGIP